MYTILKRFFLIITFLTLNQFTFSQSIDKLEFKKNIPFEISSAINQFQYQKIAGNIKKIDSLKMIIDSIKEIERKKLKKEILGIWEYKKEKCSDCIPWKNKRKEPKKFIKITKQKIVFYLDKISNENIIRIEKIKFTEQFDPFSNLKNLVFLDKTIWNFEVDNSNNYLRISNSGKETKNGRSRIVSGISKEYYKRKK